MKTQYFGSSVERLMSIIVAGGVILIFANAQASEDRATPVGSGNQASRFIGPEQLDDYIHSLSSRFAMNLRERDPFGQVQVDQPITTQCGHGPIPPIRAIKLDEVIHSIEVNTIIPIEESFTIGDRPFKKGERFPIVMSGLKYDVQITAVSSTQIDFLNVKTGEVASLKFDPIPAGMFQSGHGINVPGVVKDQKGAPLTLKPMR